MEIEETSLPGVCLIKPDVYTDERGFFLETWNDKKLSAKGFVQKFVQDNHSRSNYGVLRGLHYQIRKPQGKLVRVLNGAVFDVVVDLRIDSPTFKHWAGFDLTGDDQTTLWIPPGFAHGFVSLQDNTDLVYKCTEYFIPELDRSLRWDDPEIGIRWPSLGCIPLLSHKDETAPYLANAELFN